MKNILRKALGWVVILFLVLSAIPYAIPLSTPDDSAAEAPFAESHYVEIDAIKLHYRLWSPPGQEHAGKVLLVHGLGGSTFTWRENAIALAEAGYMVVAVDLPAFGYSDRKPVVNHSQKNRSDLLWTLLSHIDEQLGSAHAGTSWHLSGHSMGGGTVAAMAMDKPERVESLVLASGAVLDTNPRVASIAMLYPPLERWMGIALQNLLISEERITAFLRSAYGREPADYEVAGYLDPLKLPGSARSLVRLVRTARNEPVSGLAELNVPVLALWGEQDTWVPPSQIPLIQTYLPTMQVEVISGAGHVAMETHPDEFNQRLLAFLAKVK